MIPYWVKTSFAPGSKVVETYMKKAGLQGDMDELGFFLPVRMYSIFI